MEKRDPHSPPSQLQKQKQLGSAQLMNPLSASANIQITVGLSLCAPSLQTGNAIRINRTWENRNLELL